MRFEIRRGFIRELADCESLLRVLRASKLPAGPESPYDQVFWGMILYDGRGASNAPCPEIGSVLVNRTGTAGWVNGIRVEPALSLRRFFEYCFGRTFLEPRGRVHIPESDLPRSDREDDGAFGNR
jgi:hypothetical protein